MIQLITRLAEMDLDQLAQLYDLDTPDEQNRFFDTLQDTFFSIEGACYYVLTKDERYLAALRLEPYADGWLLSGLQTHHAHRRKGYGMQLVQAVAQERLVYSHIRHNNRASIALHIRAGFCKISDTARLLDGTVTSQYGTYVFKPNCTKC